MQNYILKYLLIFLVLVAGCDGWYEELNSDQPGEVPMSQILPAIEVNLAYCYGGNEAARVTGVWMQQLVELSRSTSFLNGYQYGNQDTQMYWNNMYTRCMSNCIELIQVADQKESPHWRGIGRILLVLSIAQVTDFFGDVPFGEAFGGYEDLEPSPDSQQEIYSEIQQMLDRAILELEMEENRIPVSGDLIYNGEISSWISAAWALKARYHMRLSRVEIDAAAKAREACLYALNGGFENMGVRYGSESGSEGPLYQFMHYRGDLRMAHTLISHMDQDNDSVYTSGLDDPRLPVYAAENHEGKYIGGMTGGFYTPGSCLPNPDNLVFRPDGITFFMSEMELLFIQSEALLKESPDDAAISFQNAVNKSLDEFGARDSVWFRNNIESIQPDLKDIYFQKWVALFGQAEIFHDWRRSDNEIGLKISPSAVIPQIPYRWPYPLSEIMNNRNIPEGVDLTSKMWWMGDADPGL